MRRLFAFITLAISMIVVAIIGIPTINNSIQSGTEFAGGYDILYQVTDNEGLSYNGTALENVLDKATTNINDRLNALNISNPGVSVEGKDYIRVTVPSVEETNLKTISYALANNGKITVRDSEDNLLAKGEEVFSSISLTVQGGVVYLSVKLSDYEKFEEITEEIHEKTHGTSSEQAGFVIWMGFEESYTDAIAEETGIDGDSYANAMSNPYSAWKVLAAVTVDKAISEDFVVQSTVSEERVAVVNKILSSDPVNFVLNEEYTTPVGSTMKENTPTLAIIAAIIGLAVIAVFMVIAYRYAGIASVLSIVVYAIVVLLAYNIFGGLFGTEMIVAMLIGIGLAVDANVVFLERIKDEVRKGKSIRRSYNEGSKKSVSTVLDANILVIVAAFALYLFGNQNVKSFAAIMIISQVAIMVIVILLTRLMLSLLCRNEKFQNHPEWLGVKKDEIGDVNNLEEHTSKAKFDKTNFIKCPKKLASISGAIVGLGLIVGIVCQLIFGSFFNYSSEMTKGTRIYFQTVNSEFATVEKVRDYFADEDLAGQRAYEIIIGTDKVEISDNDLVEYAELFAQYNLDVNTVSRNKVTVYNVTVIFEKELDAQSVEAINTIFEAEEKAFYDEEEEIDILRTNYSLNNYKSYSGKATVLNAIYALAMLLVFCIVYLAIRYTLSYSLTAAVTILHNVLLVVGFMAITRVSFGVEVIGACLSVAIFTINNLVITFDRLRENVSETSGVVWNKESRTEYINKSLQQTMYGHLFTVIAAIVIAIATLILCSGSILSLGIILVAGLVIATFGSFFVMPHLWIYFDGVLATVKDNRKARRGAKAKPKASSGEAEEYVFFGIND